MTRKSNQLNIRDKSIHSNVQWEGSNPGQNTSKFQLKFTLIQRLIKIIHNSQTKTQSITHRQSNLQVK